MINNFDCLGLIEIKFIVILKDVCLDDFGLE